MKYAELAQQQAQLLIDLMAQGKPFLPLLKPAASTAEKVCDFVGLERFRFEPLLDEPEVEVDPRSVKVPALEQASVPSLIHVPGMEMA